MTAAARRTSTGHFILSQNLVAEKVKKSTMKLVLQSLLAFVSLILSPPVLGYVANNKVTEDGYRIEIFECDNHLDELSTENRQRKIQGSSYRICFRPNDKALEDDIGIESITHFKWELEHKLGVTAQQAVLNNAGDNILTMLTCNDDGKLCYLDSMLTADFYVDAGSVLGYGEAIFKGNKGTVEMERYLFPHEFKFTMLNEDGSKMSDEDLEDFKMRLEAQDAAQAATEEEVLTNEASVSDIADVETEL